MIKIIFAMVLFSVLAGTAIYSCYNLFKTKDKTVLKWIGFISLSFSVGLFGLLLFVFLF